MDVSTCMNSNIFLICHIILTQDDWFSQSLEKKMQQKKSWVRKCTVGRITRDSLRMSRANSKAGIFLNSLFCPLFFHPVSPFLHSVKTPSALLLCWSSIPTSSLLCCIINASLWHLCKQKRCQDGAHPLKMHTIPKQLPCLRGAREEKKRGWKNMLYKYNNI